MALDASTVLGAPQLAGSFVNPRGLTKKMTAGAVGGLVGAALAAKVGNTKNAALPEFGRVGFVAVTADEVALVKTKSGWFKMKLSDEVLARRPRGEIAASRFDGGALSSAMAITFTDGSTWEFDIPKVYTGSAKRIIQSLGGVA